MIYNEKVIKMCIFLAAEQKENDPIEFEKQKKKGG